jgi:hypothetical protein
LFGEQKLIHTFASIAFFVYEVIDLMDPILLLWIFLVRGPTQRFRLIHKKVSKKPLKAAEPRSCWEFPLPCVIMIQTLPNVGSAPSREKATAKLL